MDDTAVAARNNVQTRPFADITFDRLIVRGCRIRPESVAAKCGQAQISFRTLDRQSDQIAHWLHGYGIRTEMRVMLVADRSIRFATTLLGILKSGATCVPVDRQTDPDMLRWYVALAEPDLILTDEPASGMPGAVKTFGRQPVNAAQVEASLGSLIPPTQGAVLKSHSATDTAFIMFTSGSTKSPMPVSLLHGAAIQYAPPEVGQLADNAKEGRNQLRPDDRVLMAAPVGNRLIRELLTPWMSAARVVLAEPGRHADIPYLASVMDAEEITVINIVPSLLEALLTTCDPADLQSLRLVDTQGEILPDETQKKFMGLLKSQLRIRYGATEIGPGLSLDCSAELLCGRPLLGLPAAGVEVHLLENGQPVQVGQEGEIYLGSPGLASGYYQKPAETAKNFVPNPFRPETFLFRTGDIGRRRGDGIIELIGRSDDRITIRGKKFFIHELEDEIKQLPGIRDASVILIDKTPSGSRLACCAVPSDDAGRHDQELIEDIRGCLQDRTILPFIVFIDTMPTTSSGKPDRQRLRTAVAQQFADPMAPDDAGSVIHKVCAVVTRIMGQPVEDSASPLAMGMNSIDAVRTCAELRDMFGVSLELADFLGASSLSEVADRVAAEADLQSNGSEAQSSS